MVVAPVGVLGHEAEMQADSAFETCRVRDECSAENDVGKIRDTLRQVIRENHQLRAKVRRATNPSRSVDPMLGFLDNPTLEHWVGSLRPQQAGHSHRACQSVQSSASQHQRRCGAYHAPSVAQGKWSSRGAPRPRSSPHPPLQANDKCRIAPDQGRKTCLTKGIQTLPTTATTTATSPIGSDMCSSTASASRAEPVSFNFVMASTLTRNRLAPDIQDVPIPFGSFRSAFVIKSAFDDIQMPSIPLADAQESSGWPSSRAEDVHQCSSKLRQLNDCSTALSERRVLQQSGTCTPQEAPAVSHKLYSFGCQGTGCQDTGLHLRPLDENLPLPLRPSSATDSLSDSDFIQYVADFEGHVRAMLETADRSAQTWQKLITEIDQAPCM